MLNGSDRQRELRGKIIQMLGVRAYTQWPRFRKNLKFAKNRLQNRNWERPPLLSYSKDGYPDVFPYEDIAHSGNDSYNLQGILNTYAGHDESVKGIIEHGVYFGDTFFGGDDFIKQRLPGVITFGAMRKNIIRKYTDRPIFTIGPYICYAKPMLSHEDTQMLKHELGRTLLVFPSHSIEGITSMYDIDGFAQKVAEFASAHEFDTTLVSLYFQDIKLGRAKPYEDQGLLVVCSGYYRDETFLRRQRSYIELADMTISNGVGTHVGYCVALGKPHMVLDGNFALVGAEEKLAESAPTYGTELTKHQMDEIKSAFSQFAETITTEQREVVREYWGLGCTKSTDELLQILLALDEAFEYCNHAPVPIDVQAMLSRVENTKSVETLNSALG